MPTQKTKTKIAILPALVSSVLVAYVAWGASVSQSTQGSCSPAVADVKGNVNITCNGLDQATVNKIINLLNEILKDRTKLDEFQQQLDKTTKRTDSLEARQAPRRVGIDQVRQLVPMLNGKSSTLVEISAVASNAEAMQYAMDLGRTLLAAGWKVEGVNSVVLLGGSAFGVSLMVRDSKSPPSGTLELLNAFRKVGIDITLLERTGVAADKIVLMVGDKPL